MQVNAFSLLTRCNSVRVEVRSARRWKLGQPSDLVRFSEHRTIILRGMFADDLWLAQALMIDKLPRAQARHDSAFRVRANPCFPGTRNSILQEITAWIDDSSAPAIFWLSGMAGVGKSTIAHTVAEQEDRKHRLGASFFFSRDQADRRNSHLVYPTIAFQLAGLDNSLREIVAHALQQDVDIGQAMMQKQFEHLIARPLAKLKGQTRTIVFVLDALDECDPDSGAVEILSRWALELPRISSQGGLTLRVLITSRPELHIHNQFGYSSLGLISQAFVLHDIEKSIVRADIELFLSSRLAELAALYGVGPPWPTVAEINALSARSDNLFIFASTTVAFIGGVKSGRSLQHRLDRLLKPDRNDATSAFTQLDALYLRVLEDAENDLEETLPDAKETFRLVLETIVLLLDPLPSTSLAGLLSLSPDDVLTSMQDLRSVLVLPVHPDSSEPIRFFHPSFYDFVTTLGRGSGSFFIAKADGHARMAKLCLETMHALLKRDPCSIGSPWLLNSDVADLQARLDRAAPNYLRYSCRFFGSHISLCAPGDATLEQVVDSFCGSKLFMWLEMMSLLGEIDGAINTIQILRSWCRVSSVILTKLSLGSHISLLQSNVNTRKLTADLVQDTYRVLLQYQSPLRLCAGSLYTTGLSFAPPCSLTTHYASELYVRYVIRGPPAQWDASLITTEAQQTQFALAYFPDGRRIATAGAKGKITVWSSSTGAEIISINEQCNDGLVRCLDVSEDGSRIASCTLRQERGTEIDVWDATTGACISHSVDHEHVFYIQFIKSGQNTLEHLTFSTMGSLRRWNSATGESTFAHKIHFADCFSMATSRCGTTIATQDAQCLRVWEIQGNNSMCPLQELANEKQHSNHASGDIFILDNQRLISYMTLFSNGVSPSSIVKLWDYRTGLELKKMEIPVLISRMAICNKGELMAAVFASSNSMKTWDIKNWTAGKELPGHNFAVLALALSPTEMVVAATSFDRTLRTWDIGETVFTDDVFTLETNMPLQGSLSASHDGNCVAGIIGGSETALLWNISEQSRSAFKLPARGYSAEVSPDGRYVACGIHKEPQNPGCVLYDTKSLERLHMWRPSQDLKGEDFSAPPAVFSRDSKRIAVSFVAYDTTVPPCSEVEVWDIHKCQKLYAASHHLITGALGIAFSPDGMSLFIASDDTCLILDVLSGTHVKEIKWQAPNGPEYFGWRLDGITPEGAQFIITSRGSSNNLHLVNVNDPSQRTEYEGFATVFRIIEAQGGYEPVCLVYDEMGNLYKQGQNSRDFLCWLPPPWRFMDDMARAIWKGPHLMIGLPDGEIGIIDVDALSRRPG